MELYIGHYSNPNITQESLKKINDLVEAGDLYLVDTSGITYGTCSIIYPLTDNLIYDICQGDDCTVMLLHPIPDAASIRGTIRITDNNSTHCYIDREAYAPQYDGLWIPSGQYLSENVSEDCCALRNLDLWKPIKYSYALDKQIWVKTVSAFTFAERGVSVQLNDDFTEISIIVNTCNDIEELPIYLCGYDKNGELLAQLIFYFTLTHVSEDETERVILVEPQQFMLSEDLAENEFNELYFTYHAYSPNSQEVVNIRSSKKNSQSACTVNQQVRLSDYITSGETSTIALQIGETAYVANVYVKTYKEVENILDIINILSITYTDTNGQQAIYTGNIENAQIVFVEDLDENLAKNPNIIQVYYKEKVIFNIEYGNDVTWFIQDYDSSKIACNKTNDGNLEIQLVDLAEWPYNSTGNPLNIILSTPSNDYHTINYWVSEGLIKPDVYEMAWQKLIEGKYEPIEGTTFTVSDYFRQQEPLYFTSIQKLNINDFEEEYGEWYPQSGLNIKYNVRQCLEVENEDGKLEYKWVDVTSTNKGIRNYDDGKPLPFKVLIGDNLKEEDLEEENLYDIQVSVASNLIDGGTGTIKFIQDSENASLTLTIVHPPIIIYTIETDMSGEIQIDMA